MEFEVGQAKFEDVEWSLRLFKQDVEWSLRMSSGV